MKKPHIIIAAIIVLFVFTKSSYADIYKCTDSKGNTFYKTEPCPEDSESETIKSAPRNDKHSENQNPKAYDYENVDYSNEDNGSRKFQKVQLISMGKLVDVVDYVEPHKYTVFMFYADWCRPCKPMKKELAKLASQVDTLAVRQLDIINWQYPLGRYYNIKSIPYVIVYGPDGKFIERGSRISQGLLKTIAASK